MNIKTKENNKFDNNYLKILAVLAFLLIILYFYRLGTIGLIDVDEPRYTEAAREMLESNNWVVPYFNYTVRYDKPVFFYWLEALSMKVFGINEFGARLPSTILAIFTVVMVSRFLKSLYGNTVAITGAIILSTSFEFAALSRFSVTDMTLSCFITSSIISFFQGYSNLSTSHRFFKQQITEFSIWYLLGFIFLAFAVLTKGPVAIILVGLICLPFFWWIKKLEYFYKSNSFYIGAVLFILIAFPWYLAVHLQTNGDFTKEFFGLHNISRYTSVVSGHKGSAFYFIPVVLIGFLPWTFFLAQAINSVIKKGLRELLLSPKEQLPWFCLWWFLVILLFFSFSKTKLLTYILPMFPAISILVSLWFNEITSSKFTSFGLVIGLGIFFVFCIGVLYFCLFNLNAMLPREVKDLKLDYQIVLLAFMLFVGISMSWASSHRNIPLTFCILSSTFILLYFCFITFLLPKIDKHSQLLLRTFAKSTPQDVRIITYQIIKPSLIFYSKRKITKVDTIGELQKELLSQNKIAFVTKKKLLEGINLQHVYKWGEDSRYIFYTNYPSLGNE